MCNNWIYVGAKRSNLQWSKVGKTTVGLEIRHTSSQEPDYFIYTAYQINNCNVHKIESALKKHLTEDLNLESEIHFSTGSSSECFAVNPDTIRQIVEEFLNKNYGNCVSYCHMLDEIDKYQCPKPLLQVYVNPLKINSISAAANIPLHLGMTAEKYFPGNAVVYETDLGEGYFFDHETGMQGHRDKDGNVEWMKTK